MKFLSSFILSLLLLSVTARPNIDLDYGANLEESHEDGVQKDNEYDYEETSDNIQPDDDDNISANVEFYTKNQVFLVQPGDSLTLPCNVSHDSMFVTMWRHNDELLYQDKIALKKIDRYSRVNQTLVISNVTKEDVGNFTCFLLKSSKTEMSVTHTIKLMEKPNIISLTAENTELSTGATLRLKCEVEGLPEPKITWSKQGESIGDHKPYLQIDNVERENAGVYQCLADNKVGVDHKFITITVNHKPGVRIERISSGVVSPDSPFSLELDCIVHGHPKPKVEWIKDNNVVEQSEHIKLVETNSDKLKLIIKEAKQSDFGKYKCRATNSLGTHEKAISLESRPSVAKFDKKMVDPKGTKITWKVDSYYPVTSYNIEYKLKDESDWKVLEETEIPMPDGSTYEITHFFTGLEAGIYQARVQATNAFGTSNYSKTYDFEIKKHHSNHHHHHHQPVVYENKDEDVTPQEHTKLESPDTMSDTETKVETQTADRKSDAETRAAESTNNSSAMFFPTAWLLSIALVSLIFSK